MERAGVVSELVPPLIRVSLLPPRPYSFETCLPIDTTNGFTLPPHSTEIMISSTNWDFYRCFFLLWTVARLPVLLEITIDIVVLGP